MPEFDLDALFLELLLSDSNGASVVVSDLGDLTMRVQRRIQVPRIVVDATPPTEGFPWLTASSASDRSPA